eukprot:291624-Rhodomonas_salina.1
MSQNVATTREALPWKTTSLLCYGSATDLLRPVRYDARARRVCVRYGASARGVCIRYGASARGVQQHAVEGFLSVHDVHTPTVLRICYGSATPSPLLS